MRLMRDGLASASISEAKALSAGKNVRAMAEAIDDEVEHLQKAATHHLEHSGAF